MTLADELKTLQEFYEEGKLTDQEYADAKAAILKKQEPVGEQRMRRSFLTRPVKALIVCFLIFLGFVLYNAGTRNTTRVIESVVHAPITLNDLVENIPAASWKAVGLNLPYSGSVNASLQVVNGNPVDVFVVTPDQVDKMNKADWINVQAYADFNAMKTKTYKRTGQLGQGSYYLVMRDTSLGILFSSASDISMKVQLNP